MQKIEPHDEQSTSGSIVAENIEALKALFPEAFGEGGVKFDVLRQLLTGGGLPVDDGEERYGLSWHGKKRARQIALTPSLGTLRPCPEESVDWETTKNIVIEGDNLEVLKLLRKSYAGKVKLIYIDPPYNTGNDFVYPDDFADGVGNYLRITGQVGEDGGKITSNTESSGRFHTNWLNMMYPRLKVAKELLSADGVIAISIDESEMANLRALCDEILGSDSLLAVVSRATGTPTGGGRKAVVSELDYLLLYSRTPQTSIEGAEMSEEDISIYDREDENGKYLVRSLRRTGGDNRREDRPTMFYPLAAPDGTEVLPLGPGGYESRWICAPAGYRKLEQQGLIEWIRGHRGDASVWHPYQKFYLEGRKKQPSNLWDGMDGNKKATRECRELFEGEKVFSSPKPVGLIRYIVQLLAADEDALILDFFAGLGTTGHAVMAQNADDNGSRRCISVQLPELMAESSKAQQVACRLCDRLGKPRTIAELTKERLRRAGKKIKEENKLFHGDTGFRVFKLDTSNLKPWDPRPDDVELRVKEWIENIRVGRTMDDLLYELLLKLGLDLCVPIEVRAIADKTVHNIGAGTLMVCLDKSISRDDVEPLGLGLVRWAKQLAPAGGTQFVFRDSAFADDVAKTNLDAILRQNLPDDALAAVRSL